MLTKKLLIINTKHISIECVLSSSFSSSGALSPDSTFKKLIFPSFTDTDNVNVEPAFAVISLPDIDNESPSTILNVFSAHFIPLESLIINVCSSIKTFEN